MVADWLHRRPFLAGLGVGAVIVLVVALVITAVLLRRDPGPTNGVADSPEEAVQTYLDALAAADGAALVRVTTPAPSDRLLGEAVLRQQRALSAITDIAVMRAEAVGASDQIREVRATYRVGDRAADVRYRSVRSGKGWLVSNGVLQIDLDPGRVPGPTLFDVEIGSPRTLYVYPGPQVWGSANPYLSAKVVDPQPFPLGPQSPVRIRLDAELDDAGVRAVGSAVRNHLERCAGSRETDAATDRPGCSQTLYRSARPGTVRWRAPDDASGLYSTLSRASVTTVDVAGPVSWQADYTPTYVSDGTTRSVAVDQYLVGSVDLTVTPPAFLAE